MRNDFNSRRHRRGFPSCHGGCARVRRPRGCGGGFCGGRNNWEWGWNRRRWWW